MDAKSEDTRRNLRQGAKRTAMGVLIVLALLTLWAALINPAFAALPVLFAAAAFGVHWLVRVDDVRKATEVAHELGARGPITHTGKVVHYRGTCPSGAEMHEGEEFSIADGRIWPSLCPHAEQAIFDAIPHMNDNPNPLSAPVHFNDGAHELDLDLNDVREESRAA